MYLKLHKPANRVLQIKQSKTNAILNSQERETDRQSYKITQQRERITKLHNTEREKGGGGGQRREKGNGGRGERREMGAEEREGKWG